MKASILALAIAAGLACDCDVHHGITRVEAQHPYVTGATWEFDRCDHCGGVVDEIRESPVSRRIAELEARAAALEAELRSVQGSARGAPASLPHLRLVQ